MFCLKSFSDNEKCTVSSSAFFYVKKGEPFMNLPKEDYMKIITRFGTKVAGNNRNFATLFQAKKF
jgi:hypothetical protein